MNRAAQAVVVAMIMASEMMASEMVASKMTAIASGSSQREAFTPAALAAAPSSPSPEVLDRVIAVVNGDVLLESDVREEMRFAILQPYTVPPGSNTAQRAAGRLISRSLILQQMKEQHSLLPVGDDEVDKRISETRKLLPACSEHNCEADDGWAKFLLDNDLTIKEVRERMRAQLQILKFIEVRFRAGIRVSQPEIEEFYHKTLLPQFDKSTLSAPPIAAVSARVEEIILQQKVNLLLQQWLRSLRAQGSVQILDLAYSQSSSLEAEAGGNE